MYTQEDVLTFIEEENVKLNMIKYLNLFQNWLLNP